MWATMNARYPQDESAEAMEGTAAHWAAWELLANRPCRAGTIAPNGIIVTDEMLDGGELLIETIEQRGMSDLHIEETLPIPFIHPKCFGTPDVWAAGLGKFHINIVDYKFGHRFVDEYFNPQGLLYLLGILNKLDIQWSTDKSVSVDFTIVQPRCFYRGSPVRTHSFMVKDAEIYFRQLQLAAQASIAPSIVATTNSHCDNCPGRHACPTLQQAAYSDAEYASERQPFDLSPRAAALELRMLERAYERLGARVDGLRELTLANLKKGSHIPYYRIEQGKGRQQWNVPTEQVIAIGQMFGKDLSKPGVLTPAQAKKAGVDESVIRAYSSVPSGNLKLVAENPADARKVFGQGE